MKRNLRSPLLTALVVMAGSLALAINEVGSFEGGSKHAGALQLVPASITEEQEMRDLHRLHREFRIAQRQAAAGNAGVIGRIYRAFGRGDVTGFLGALAPQIEFTEMAPVAGTFTGPEAVLNDVLVNLVSAWEASLTFERLIDAGDTIVVQGFYSSTYKPTGKSLIAPFVHVWELRDGKVVKYTQYTDTLAFAEAMR